MAVDAARAKSLFLNASDLADPAARAAYLDRECGGDAELRGRVEALLRADDAAPLPPALGKDATVDSGAVESDPDMTSAHTPPSPSVTPDNHAQVELGSVIAGRYTLVEVIGEGGMGSVYLAEQTEPVKRQVALKLIKSGMDSKGVLARFDAERQALALMDHPNIARIYDGGVTPLGQPFFVMELVKGVPLTAYCDSKRLTVDARLQLFVQVCQAVQHAHQKGIIHRDLKPGNVLVTEVDGRPTPKVIDFGVAKATEQKLTEMSFSDVGAIVGTPAYMSPEQADPSSMDIDTRTDVYALGVMLYELLTGSPPIDSKQFQRGAILEMLRMVREVEPPRPSTKLSTDDALPNIASNRNIEPAKLSRLLQGELDWVVMKSLEKDRTRRYDTANGLAADIQRYLADEVVEARPPSRGYRLKKFVKRNKGQVLAASLVLLALVGGIVGTSIGLVQADKRRVEAEQARADEAARVTERDDALGKRDIALVDAKDALDRESERVKERDYQLGISDYLLAVAAYDNRDVVVAADRLRKVPEGQRGWEWAYLKQQLSGGLFTLYGHTGSVTSVSFSPDGTRIATGARVLKQPGEAKVWDARTGTLRLDLKGHKDWVTSVSFSPDGSRLVTGSRDRTAKVWDARTGTPLLDLKGHTDTVLSVTFSPDGSRLVTGCLDRMAMVWDARTGTHLFDLKGHTGGVMSGTFSPDGSRIVTGSRDQTAKVWDARTGALLLDLKGHTAIVGSVGFSPDGARIVTGSQDQTAKVWDARTGTGLLDLKGHTREVMSVTFSPDGTRIVTGSFDKTARVWDARIGTALLDLKGHTGGVESVSFSPDGTGVVTGSEDHTAKVWDARTGTPRLDLKGHTAWVTSVCFSPDRSRIVTASGDHTAKVWDARTGTPLLDLKGHTEIVESVCFSPDGSRIVTASGDHTAKVWDARTGTPLLDLKGHTDWVFSVSFSPDGTRLVTGSFDKTARVWDARTGTPLLELKGHRALVHSVSFSPDGSRIVTGSFDKTAKVWDARTGTALLDLKGHTDIVLSVSFSPDGSRIVTGNNDRTAKVWDARTGTPLLDLRGHASLVWSVSFSPDGARLVTGSGDHTAKVWDARTGTPLLDLKGHTGGVRSVTFSPDGSRIVTGSFDKTAKVWDVRTGQELKDGQPLDAEERNYRLFYTRPNDRNYAEGYEAATNAKDRFAARFYLDRILSLPEQRTTAWFQFRNAFQADPLVIARTSFHHSALAKVPYDRGIIQMLAVNGDRLGKRLVAQELLRDAKPQAAVPLLFECMLWRPTTSPPVEELLLAQAYLDLKQPDEAKRFYNAAANWLDRPRDPKDNLGVGFALNGDPRRNPFDWEAWHECDVFRAGLEHLSKNP